MFNLNKLIQNLSFRDRSLFRNLFKREAVDFNKDGFTMVVGNLFGVRGTYITADGAIHHNTTTAEGQQYLLATGLAGGAAEAAWYLALWNNNTTPQESWTAATFATTANEITSSTDGYSETTRQVWTPDAPASDPMSNSANPAAFTIALSTLPSLSIVGAALISDATKGGTGGVLFSAVAFSGGARTQYNGDVFTLIHEESLQPV